MPAYLNALAGEGVHIVTVNDYLARRDSEWNGPIFEWLGLRLIVLTNTSPTAKNAATLTMPILLMAPIMNLALITCVITWCIHPDEMVQRKHHYAMVDEVDSVLIDDARTPLIISGPVPKGDDQQYPYSETPGRTVGRSAETSGTIIS